MVSGSGFGVDPPIGKYSDSVVSGGETSWSGKLSVYISGVAGVIGTFKVTSSSYQYFHLYHL